MTKRTKISFGFFFPTCFVSVLFFFSRWCVCFENTKRSQTKANERNMGMRVLIGKREKNEPEQLLCAEKQTSLPSLVQHSRHYTHYQGQLNVPKTYTQLHCETVPIHQLTVKRNLLFTEIQNWNTKNSQAKGIFLRFGIHLKKMKEKRGTFLTWWILEGWEKEKTEWGGKKFIG